MTDLPESIQDESLRRLYLYWKTKADARWCPARADIDPLDFVYVLGWVTLVDVLHRPLRFRFRLYGSELAHRMGMDLTGRYLDQHPDRDFGAMLQKSWQQVVEQGAPVCVHYERVVGERRRRWESLRMPLSTDGSTIDMLLAGTRPLD